MAKKQDSFYFDTFISCMDDSCRAAELLSRVMEGFDPQTIEGKLDEMHEVEHAADMKKHELLRVLDKAFMTPIEREDILLLSQNIDEVTDKIEDVLLRLFCDNIQTMRPDALEFCQLLIRCCQEATNMIREFADFKRSKTLRSHIVNINTLEEEADKLYIRSLRTLHTTCTDTVQIMVWREIYTYLEKCVDACEHVADTVERVLMKNT